jgi:hypothetical protein
MLKQSKLASARQAYKIGFYFGQISIISVIEMVPAKNKKDKHWFGFWAQTFYLEQIAQGSGQTALLMAAYKIGS